MRQGRAVAQAAALAVLLGGAAGGGPDDLELLQTVASGKVNWSARRLEVVGRGPPRLRAVTVVAARRAAEAAARQAVLRGLGEVLRGLPLQGDERVADLLARRPDTTAQIDAICRGYRVVDTRYYADGGVDLVAQLPLDGALGELLAAAAAPSVASAAFAGAALPADANPAPPADAAAAAADPLAAAPPSRGGDATTGVLVNARGVAARPCLLPRLRDGRGHELFGAAAVSREAVRQRGVAAYARSLDAARKDVRIADRALIVRAVATAPGPGCDLVLDDAASLAPAGEALAEGRVIVVLD